MIYTTVEQIKSWIEANLDYFWNYPEEGYFFLDLEILPIETKNLEQEFNFFITRDELWKSIFATKSYIAIDLVVDNPKMTIVSCDTVYEMKFAVNRLITESFELKQKKSYSALELQNSYKNLMDLLSGR